MVREQLDALGQDRNLNGGITRILGVVLEFVDECLFLFFQLRHTFSFRASPGTERLRWPVFPCSVGLGSNKKAIWTLNVKADSHLSQELSGTGRVSFNLLLQAL